MNENHKWRQRARKVMQKNRTKMKKQKKRRMATQEEFLDNNTESIN